MSAVAENTVVTFRDAVAADVPAIVALVESAYRGDASRAGWTTEADMLDGQRVDPIGVGELVARPLSRILLAENAGTLLACCHLERQGEACYFGMFSVKPTQQGGGVGRRMLLEAERLAHDEWKCTKMEMTVISIREELIAWYERRGYRRSGVFKPFPYGDERFGIPKRDDLRFELLEKRLDAGRET
jgi:GNAT superfamily N-acetyltransferase